MLEQNGIEATLTVKANKQRFEEEDAWDLIKDADRIEIAKGKKTLVFDPSKDAAEIILKEAMGRSGNLRAPAMREGKVWYIGFHPDFFDN